MKKTCLLDLDGTLTDPKERIMKAVAYALKRFSIQIDIDCILAASKPDHFATLASFHWRYNGYGSEEELCEGRPRKRFRIR